MNSTSQKKGFGSLPVSKEKYELVKKKQLEMTHKSGKMLSLTEVTDKIIEKGLLLVE